MRYTKEQIDAKFRQLDDIVKDAILSTKTDETMQEIGKKYELHIDTMGDLVREAVYVMVGLEPHTAFVENLKQHVNIPPEKVDGVAKEVNARVFEEIRNALKKETETKTPVGEAAREPTEPVAGSVTVPEPVAPTEKEEPTPTSIPPAEVPVPAGPQSVPPENLPTGNVTEQKLGGAMNTFAQTQTVKSVSPDAPQGSATQESKRAYKEDPYHEPIDSSDLNLPKNR